MLRRVCVFQDVEMASLYEIRSSVIVPADVSAASQTDQSQQHDGRGVQTWLHGSVRFGPSTVYGSIGAAPECEMASALTNIRFMRTVE